MSLQVESSQREPFMNEHRLSPSGHGMASLPPPALHASTPSPGEPMEVASPRHAAMGPPTKSSPDLDINGSRESSSAMIDYGRGGSSVGPNAAAAAQAGAQAPKVVQTAFIHKLYNMLEDPTIQHLISWSNTAESFVMSPSNDFSKVLSQYFKHTNISSFVRQLNMYGFHKVSDVFHTGSPESPLWEFKHGNGNFKRGDLVGLREIKRRASRHALVHRDSYSAVKPPPYPQPTTPAELVPPVPESTESRLTSLEHHLYEVNARLSRSDDNANFLHVRNQVVMDALSRSLQLNCELSRIMIGNMPNLDSMAQRSILDLQREVQRQTDMLRSLEDPQESPFTASRPYFSNLSLESTPISPRQMAQDDSRRGSLVGMSARGPPPFRPAAVPSHLSITPRRYGSIGGGSSGPAPPTASSPSSLRYTTQAPPPPPPPQPPHQAQSPPTNLPRRHTSADIRAHGWQPMPSPFGPSNASAHTSGHTSGHASSHWPSSPKRAPSIINEDQHIRDSLSTYSLQSASQSYASNSRPTTPPFVNGHGAGTATLGSWAWGASSGDKFGGAGFGLSGLLKDDSAPATRRSSMAHILNPAETAERDEEREDEMRDEDRKRKRI